jgi:hypothetical protein
MYAVGGKPSRQSPPSLVSHGFPKKLINVIFWQAGKIYHACVSDMRLKARKSKNILFKTSTKAYSQK